MLITNLQKLKNTKSGNVILLILVGLFLTIGCKKKLPEYVAIAYDELPEKIQFSIHVKPILSDIFLERPAT